MKKLIFFSILFSVFTISCKDLGPLIEENGLTKNINDIVPQTIIDEMITLGMPINTGNNPPDIGMTSTGKSYKASPFILKSSNRSGDSPGYAFADYYVKLYDQNNTNLSIKIDYQNGGESGSGLGGFIVGENNKFSIFAEVNSSYSGYNAVLVHVISGTLTTTGITDLYFANFMTDNDGNLGNVWIENGEGRVIYDSDGFSEIVSSFGAPKQKVKTYSGAVIL